MGMTFYPYDVSKHMYRFAWYDNLLSADELNDIRDFCSNLKLKDAKTGDKNSHDDNSIRKSKVAFVNYSNDNHWLFSRLRMIAENINDNYYRFDLTGFDSFQYTEYQGQKSHYDFHVDMFYNEASSNANLDQYYQARKLSISLLLNDSSEFEGGNFEFSNVGSKDDVEVAEQKIGRAIGFPSFVPHRVTPVLSGVRKSLVYWVTGPKFR